MRGFVGLLAAVVVLPLGVLLSAVFALLWTVSGIGFWLDTRARRREESQGAPAVEIPPADFVEPLNTIDGAAWASIRNGLSHGLDIEPEALAPLDAAIETPDPWAEWVHKRKASWLRRIVEVLRGAFLGALLAWTGWAWRLGLRHWLRPKLVFVVYPGTRRQVRLYTSPALMGLAPDVVPLGAIRRDASWGVYATLKEVVTEHADNPQRIGQLLEEVRETFPYARSVALAGRFPGVAHRAGLPVETPFVDGVLGTVYSMDRAIAALAERSTLPAQELHVCVLGGGGFVGRALVPLLADTYGRVIAIDPRFAEARGEQDGVLRTHLAADVGQAHVVLVLTSRGDDVWMYLPYAREGQIWGDDTHPEMTEPVRRALVGRGVDLWKVSVGDERLHLWPPLSTLPPRATPGCMLMAAVHSHFGPSALEDLSSFAKAADQMGFEACLDRHHQDEADDGMNFELQPEVEGALVDAFQRLDRNGDGRISTEEFLDQLENQLSRREVEVLIRFADIDGDGLVDYQEFARALALLGGGEAAEVVA